MLPPSKGLTKDMFTNYFQTDLSFFVNIPLYCLFYLIKFILKLSSYMENQVNT